MNVFIFQSVPERYDLRTLLMPGLEKPWFATRYRSEMHRGDVVFFWMAGDEHFRGIYGWGRLSTEPYLDKGSHYVDVQYEVKFARPISWRALQADPQLAALLIFRAPQATNFLLTPREAKRVVALVRDKGEQVPDLRGDES